MILKPAPNSAPLLRTDFPLRCCIPRGVPAGGFQTLVQGSGSVVGTALSGHPDVDPPCPFTGSEFAGVEIAKNAATTVEAPCCQELGGKEAAFIVLDDGRPRERAVHRRHQLHE